MTIHSGQPEVRFDKAGPYGFQGISFLPKVILVKKTITAAGYDDFWTIPAGTFVSRVSAFVKTALNATNSTMIIGVDGDTDLFLNGTDLNVSTAGNFATSIGASADGKNGYFFPAADVMRITAGGSTLTSGEVRVMVEYFEVDAMAARNFHFEE